MTNPGVPEVLSPLVSPQYAFVLDGVSAFPRSCLPLSSSNVSLRFLEWCARLSRSCLPWSPIVPHCFPFSPIVFLYVCLCWMVCPPSRSLISHCLPKWGVRLPDVLFPNCLPLSPHVCLCWMVCPPSRGLVSLVSLLVYLCLRLSPIVSRCPQLSPIVPKSCLSLSPIVSLDMCACVGWCVRLPEVLSPPCLPWSPFLFPCVGWCVRLPRFCLPCLPACLPSCLPDCLPTCLSSCFPLWWVVWFCIFFKQCTVRG